jgi:hypothetical protein
MTVSGTIDIKRQGVYAWSGTKYLIDVSNPTTSSHQITDSVREVKCHAYKNGECRTGSTAGDFFVSLSSLDILSSSVCWLSQMNVKSPCAFAGPTEIGQARMIWIASPDDSGLKQIYLGRLLVGPEQSQVYSALLPTPDGRYGIFTGIDMSGYHTGLIMTKLPDVSHLDSINRTSYSPIFATGSSAGAVYVEFGYEEYGSDGVTKFYCTSRKENCRVGSGTINEAVPFQFASTDTPVTTTGSPFIIAAPGISGMMMVYRVVIDGVAQPTQYALL